MQSKNNFLLFLVILLNSIVYSQNNFFHYERVKVREIDSIEKQFNSKIYNSKLDYVASQKDGKIINYGKLKVYSREQDKVLGFVDVEYIYLKNDSLVNSISYYWESPKNTKLKDYSKQFDKTVKKISADLNLSIGDQGKLTKKMDDEVPDGIPIEITEKRVVWKYKNAQIRIIMIWTEKRGAYLNTDIEWEK